MNMSKREDWMHLVLCIIYFSKRKVVFIWRPFNRCLCIANYLNTQAQAGPPHVLWDLPVLRWGELVWAGFLVIFSAESSEMGIVFWSSLAIPYLPVQLLGAIPDNPSVCVGRGGGTWEHWILLWSTVWCPTAEGRQRPPQTAHCLDPWGTGPVWAMHGHWEMSQNDSFIPRLANAWLPVLPDSIRGVVGWFRLLESSGSHRVSITAGLSLSS